MNKVLFTRNRYAARVKWKCSNDPNNLWWFSNKKCVHLKGKSRSSLGSREKMPSLMVCCFYGLKTDFKLSRESSLCPCLNINRTKVDEFLCWINKNKPFRSLFYGSEKTLVRSLNAPCETRLKWAQIWFLTRLTWWMAFSRLRQSQQMFSHTPH